MFEQDINHSSKVSLNFTDLQRNENNRVYTLMRFCEIGPASIKPTTFMLKTKKTINIYHLLLKLKNRRVGKNMFF